MRLGTFAGSCAVMALLSSCSRGGSDPAESFSVTLEAPAFTRGPTVSVRVNAPGDVERVDLALDGVVLGELLPPYEFIWRIDGVPEGSYVFEARARRGGVVAISSPATVVIDRTPPEVVSITPAPGSSAWTRTPVEITFSEPIAPASVGTDVLAISGPGAGPESYPRVLSPDGLRLSTRVAVGANLPTSVDLELRPGLTDLAGNPLVIRAPWTLFYPEWISIPLAEVPDLYGSVFDGLVAWGTGPLGFGYQVSEHCSIALRTAGDWSTVEVPIGNTVTRIGGGPDAVLVANTEPNGQSNGVQVDRVTAAGVASLGFTSPPGVETWGPIVGVDPNGVPLVAAHTLQNQVTVARWNGSGWERLGEPLGANTDMNRPIAFGPGGAEPILVWAGFPLPSGAETWHVSRFDGTGWVPIGGAPLTNGLGGRIAADADGHVFLASRENGMDAVLRHWDGNDWTVLASFRTTDGPTLVPWTGGQFWFGWVEYDGSAHQLQFRAYRADGTYTDLPATIDTTGLGDPVRAWIAVDEYSDPVVAWMGQLPGGAFRVYAWQRNR